MALESSFRVTPSSAADAVPVFKHVPSAGYVSITVRFTPLTGGLGAPVRHVYGLHSLWAGVRFLRTWGSFFRGIINEAGVCRMTFNKSPESRPAFIWRQQFHQQVRAVPGEGVRMQRLSTFTAQRLSESQMVPAGGLLPQPAPKRAQPLDRNTPQ